ncbi:MAG TPA: DUF465 domain-containing protein [Persephonella sp.]|nr:DUF465 domain-containing protein [Hydrogenothermaceae bacterium]HIQ25496.1 DUF465 domain-containing protein [Persephonella sp.]
MTREEAIQKLLETDPEFKEWYEEHEELKWKVHKLDKHNPPDPELEAEEQRLKRRKLYLKDLMEIRIKEFIAKNEQAA